MRRLRVRIVLAVAIFGLLGVPGIAPSAVVASPEKPERVLIIVLDQVRQDTLSRYKMTNVRGLMSEGVSFPNAYLGHMAAETVISHNVITSGQFPKNMGWSNEVYRDVGDVLGLGDGAYYVTSSMSCAQFDALITARGYLKLQDYLDARFDDPDTTGSDDSTFAAIAEKRTAACSAGHTTDAALDPGDFIFQIRGSGAGTDVTCDGITSSVWRKPEAVSRPAYIEDPNVCSRWWTRQSTSPPLDYGTTTQAPAWMYPLEGNRFMPGTDPGHTGGDAWSADAAIEVIENDPDWRGMLVSLGAIDKAGHMWGPDDKASGPTHLPALARIADQQVGEIVAALDEAGQLDETLIVVTTDHGAQTGKRFYGIDQPGRGDFNWYCGRAVNGENYLSPSPAIASFATALGGDCDSTTADGGNLAFSYQDSQIAAWLIDTSLPKLQQAAVAMRNLPEVIAAYYREGDHYVRHGSLGKMSDGERRWFNLHAQELLDTMAAPFGPDVVGLLRNDVTYGVKGDHGGHQEQVQTIPIIFSWPGLSPGATPSAALRSVDILPTILTTMGIDYDAASMDGTGFTLPTG